MKHIPWQGLVAMIWVSAIVMLQVPLVRETEHGYDTCGVCISVVVVCLLGGFIQGMILAPRHPVYLALAGWCMAALVVPTLTAAAAYAGEPFLFAVVPALATIGFFNGARYRADRRVCRIIWVGSVAVVIGGMLYNNEALFNCLPKHIWQQIVFAPRP